MQFLNLGFLVCELSTLQLDEAVDVTNYGELGLVYYLAQLFKVLLYLQSLVLFLLRQLHLNLL